MQYSIEVFVDDHETCEFHEDGVAPFPSPSAGDLLHPSWRIGETAIRYRLGDRHRVIRVEHVWWPGNHKLMVYCDPEVIPPGEPA